jgi:uncharacterized protein YndB with AHSA1/START domain
MRDIVIRRTYPYPRLMVWEAITDREQLAAWLMPNDFKPLLGHEFTFRTDPAPGFDGIVKSRVLAIEPPSHLKISWKGGPLDTIVAFHLEETAEGTALTLRHTGFRGVSNLVPRFILGLGWKRKVLVKLGERVASSRR